MQSVVRRAVFGLSESSRLKDFSVCGLKAEVKLLVI